MSRRARPMSQAERRDDLTDVTLRLLRVHGSAVTTRQIAEAAGVAEGTIFRVFDSKEELVDAAVARAFEPGDIVARIQDIDHDQTLRLRLVAVVAVTQQWLRATFDLMQKMGHVRPPVRVHDSEEAQQWRAQFDALLADLVGDDADRLTVPVVDFLHALRLLTVAGSHEHIANERLLTPDQIVDTVLLGLQRRD